MKIKFKVVCLNGEGERELQLPGKYNVCTRCEGKGTHVNPAIDSHGISPEEFDEDPDFRENYFSGVYDIPCEECGGERVIAEVNFERLPKKLRERIENQLAEKAAYEDEKRHHARMCELGMGY